MQPTINLKLIFNYLDNIQHTELRFYILVLVPLRF